AAGGRHRRHRRPHRRPRLGARRCRRGTSVPNGRGPGRRVGHRIRRPGRARAQRGAGHVAAVRRPGVTTRSMSAHHWPRAAVVALVALLWGALPVGAGDPVGQITEFTDGLTHNNGPNRITNGPDGNLWFTEGASAAQQPQQTAKIGRITPSGVVTEFTNGL